MSFLRKYRLTLSIVGIVVVALIILSFSRHTQLPIRTDTALRETITNSIATNGKVEPVQNFEAHAPAAAAVKRVLVQQGQQVKAGQLLVQLDDAEARASAAKALAQLRSSEAESNASKVGGTQEEVLTNRASLAKAQAEADAAQRNLNAVQKLQQTGAASTGELEEAQNRLKRAQADLTLLKQKQTGRFSSPELARVQAQAEEARASYDAAQATLKNTDISSPIDGMVYSLPVRAGSYVNAGDLVVQVAKFDKMQVRAFVDEPEIGKLALGQDALVTWDAMNGRTWPAKVVSVPTTVIAHGTRNVGEVICSIDNNDGKLLPNVNVNVTLVTAQHANSVTVPREAVFQDGNKRFVFTVADGKLKRQEVDTGISNLTKIQITRGIDEGATVALGTVNGQPMQDGNEVKIVEQRK